VEPHECGGKNHLAHALAYRNVVGQGKFDQTVERETVESSET